MIGMPVLTPVLGSISTPQEAGMPNWSPFIPLTRVLRVQETYEIEWGKINPQDSQIYCAKQMWAEGFSFQSQLINPRAQG